MTSDFNAAAYRGALLWYFCYFIKNNNFDNYCVFLIVQNMSLFEK